MPMSFLQAYRPGALAARGFGPDDAARLRPGIVYVSVCAYGYEGPWASRRGFDSLVQSASGIAATEQRAAASAEPRHLPCQALDHATGYLAAFGAMAALARRATEGGSWHVKVSLAQTGRWLQSFGEIPDGWQAPELALDDVRDCLETVQSGVWPRAGRAACRAARWDAGFPRTATRADRHARGEVGLMR